MNKAGNIASHPYLLIIPLVVNSLKKTSSFLCTMLTILFAKAPFCSSQWRTSTYPDNAAKCAGDCSNLPSHTSIFKPQLTRHLKQSS